MAFESYGLLTFNCQMPTVRQMPAVCQMPSASKLTMEPKDLYGHPEPLTYPLVCGRRTIKQESLSEKISTGWF